MKQEIAYVSGYKGIHPDTSFDEVCRDLENQAKTLSCLFETPFSFDVSTARVLWNTVLLSNARKNRIEKLFLVLPWKHIATTYSDAVCKGFEILNRVYDGAFSQYDKGESIATLLQSTPWASKQRRITREKQPGQSLYIVPAQLGALHGGVSASSVCKERVQDEYGLNVFSTLCILATHPHRLQTDTDLFMCCLGDKYNEQGSSKPFDCVPLFLISNKKLEFSFQKFTTVSPFSGIASAFVL